MKNIVAAFGIIGSLATGKSTTREMLLKFINRYFPGKAVLLDSSQYLENLALERGLPTTREVKQQLCAEFEPNHVAIELFKQVQELEEDNVILVIDSIRPDNNLDPTSQARKWQELIPNITFIYLDASDDLRFVRYNQREQDNGRPRISREAFNKKHDAATDRNIAKLKELVPPENILVGKEYHEKRDLQAALTTIFEKALSLETVSK